MNDPIVDEIRRVRDAHASQFNYDLDAILQDIKDQEKKSGHQFVNGVAHPGTPIPLLESTGGIEAILPNTTTAEGTTGS